MTSILSKSFAVATIAFVLVAAACSSSDSSGGGSTTPPGTPPGSPPSSPPGTPPGSPPGTPPTTPPTTDGGVDGDTGAPVSVQPDGNYAWGTWTCGHAGGTTIDIKAFAQGLGIQSVVTHITGATGSVDVIYSATCTRTTALTSVEYPSAGMIKSTAAGTYTCTATCPGPTCTAGSQTVIVDTFALTASGSTYTYTRVLDAGYLAGISLQKAAGCQAGDTEIATHIKQ